jgi:hypothetical protein
MPVIIINDVECSGERVGVFFTVPMKSRQGMVREIPGSAISTGRVFNFKLGSLTDITTNPLNPNGHF